MSKRSLYMGLLAAGSLALALLSGSCSTDRTAIPPADTTPPAAITNLATGVATSNSVALTWTSPGDDGASGTAAQYDIRFALTPITMDAFTAATPVTGEPQPAVAGTNQSMTVTGLNASTVYYFAMKTADEMQNWSVLSNVATDTTAAPPDNIPPAAIADLATGAVTPSSVILTWTAPGDDGALGTATQYDIRYLNTPITAENFAASSPVTGEPVPAVAGTSQSMTVTGLNASTPYYFAMKAADEVPNWSALSNTATDTTSARPDTIPPAAILDLATGTVTSSSVALTWTAPGDDDSSGTAAQYDIRYSIAPITSDNFAAASPATGTPTPAVAGTSQSMTVTELNPDTPYYFAVKTADEVPNWSAISNTAGATTSPPPDTTPPAAIIDLATGTVTSDSVFLTWTSPGDDGTSGTATRYDIRYSIAPITSDNFSAAPQVTGEPAPIAAGTSQSMTVTRLAGGTPYYFAMKTVDEALNWSAISNTVSATTLPPPDTTPPAAVFDLVATALNGRAVELTWTAPGDDGSTGTAHAFDVRYSLNPITAENFAAATQFHEVPIPGAAGTSENATKDGLSPETDYYFALKTMDEVPNTSDISNIAHVRTLSEEAAPPALVHPVFPDTVCITSSDQYAQSARSLALSKMALPTESFAPVAPFLDPWGLLPWQIGGGCWDNTHVSNGCSSHYHVCQSGTVYNYILTLDGSCLGQSASDWVAFSAGFYQDSGQTYYYLFEPNSINVTAHWVVSTAADQNSGSYEFHQGASTAVAALAEWTKSADGNTWDLSYTVPLTSRMTAHLVKSPCSGLLRTYRYTNGTPVAWVENEIQWNANGTGFWDVYTEAGGRTEHHTW